VDSADSPFHGFFTLFWLGTAIFMLKLAAENWQNHGNILGTNEIMGLMFHRDVMVLGLSDGVMCAATGFGLIMQKLIVQGVISWNKEGWIIQSVSFIIYRGFLEHSEKLADNTFCSYGKLYTSLPSLVGRSLGSGLGRTQSFLYCMD
jgi:hypothetical protein